MKKALVLILLALSILSLGVGPVNGQANDVPWPPDPAKLFPKSVKVVKTRLLLGNSPSTVRPITETKCGKIQGIDDSSLWVITKNKNDGRYYLCELATGELSNRSLPDEYDWSWFKTTEGYPVSTSPDGKWLFFEVYPKDDFNSPFVYFSYEIKTGKLLNLGKLYYREEFSERWATNTDYFIQTRDVPEWSVADAYVIDITQPDSLKKVVSTLRFDVKFKDNPPRLETFDSPSNDGGMDGGKLNCKRSIY